MTPEQRDLVISTLEVVEQAGAQFSIVFFDRLFELDPSIRVLFPSDLGRQRAQLVPELSFFVAAVADLPAFIERARRLGALHHRGGARPEHYEVAEGALLAALSCVLGATFTTDVERAWRRLYRLIAETMLEGSASELFAPPP
jgi:hemoglobin-like flavoprotein